MLDCPNLFIFVIIYYLINTFTYYLHFFKSKIHIIHILNIFKLSQTRLPLYLKLIPEHLRVKYGVLIIKSNSYSNIWQNSHIRIYIHLIYFDVTITTTDILFYYLSDTQWCKVCSREHVKTPCVSITFHFTASRKTREKLPNKKKMQMCEFLCSLLKWITQMVTRFDCT